MGKSPKLRGVAIFQVGVKPPENRRLAALPGSFLKRLGRAD